MDGTAAATMLRNEHKYLSKILRDFEEEHADFRPADGMMTVAQQIRHIAATVSWFRKGAFGAGFDMDFGKLEAKNLAPTTLGEAMKKLDATYDAYAAFLEPLDEGELMAPMAPNPIFGEAPKMLVLIAGGDHTAHHRGALSVYLRLVGVKPAMIYEG